MYNENDEHPCIVRLAQATEVEHCVCILFCNAE